MIDNRRFDKRYTVSGGAEFLAAELESLGTDYQATGYTTLAQANEIGDLLALSPGQLLLDIGAGCGFPGLYLAKRHGCSVISLDPVAAGIRVAHQRGISDGLSKKSWVIQAEAQSIPLQTGSVDAVVQSDVLC